MSDERTGRELTPRDPDRDEVVVRERPEAQTPERFYAGDSAHVVGLTEERAAQIVRQSGNARSIAFLATLIVALFIPIYWFYDLGFPAIAGSSRLEAEAKAQQVTDIGRGHELYLANCAQCHGPEGKGGIGPPLNDQAKLYNALTSDGRPGTGHLNPNYLQRVLEVGGRYVCGDPDSIMPAWLQPAGPLNYRQVEELIAFLTASKDISYVTTPAHPIEEGATNEPTEPQQGWRDPSYQPAPGSSPVPECWRPYSNPAFPQASAGASLAPVESPGTVEAPREIAVK
ncbi:MAG: cytochrome c, partial [Chloroflexi bacterium]|nr:cytochrome c [Chloroflexota bacterium]